VRMIDSSGTEVLIVRTDNGVEDLVHCVVIPYFCYKGSSGISLTEALNYFTAQHDKVSNAKNKRMKMRYSSPFKVCKRLLFNEIMSIGSNFEEYNKYSVHFITEEKNLYG